MIAIAVCSTLQFFFLPNASAVSILCVHPFRERGELQKTSNRSASSLNLLYFFFVNCA